MCRPQGYSPCKDTENSSSTGLPDGFEAGQKFQLNHSDQDDYLSAMKTIAVIGGGAAGYFAAIHAGIFWPEAVVTLYEKSSKVLSKVRISGGGRCNVTHACFDPDELVKNYPRGGKELRGAFHQFHCADTVKWFEERGVRLKAEADGRMFPVSDSSESIIRCLVDQAEKAGVRLKLNSEIEAILVSDQQQAGIRFHSGEVIWPDAVIVATGGSPALKGFDWLSETQHTIVPPVPSLFTFNVPDNELNELMGVSVANARIRLPDHKTETRGPLLITHWGFSGPAVLRLSSLCARELAAADYRFRVVIGWIDAVEEDLRKELSDIRMRQSARSVSNSVFPSISKRLWEYLLRRSGIETGKKWGDVSNSAFNKLLQVLLHDAYQAKGKTTFKEEFVTCGGISLKEIDFKHMASKKVKGLFFAGEVLDIDAITGGFNFQAAWTTGFLASRSALSQSI